jgi:hypothetical protein
MQGPAPQGGAPIFSVRLFCFAKNRAFRFNLLAVPKGFTLHSLARPRASNDFARKKLAHPTPHRQELRYISK